MGEIVGAAAARARPHHRPARRRAPRRSTTGSESHALHGPARPAPRGLRRRCGPTSSWSSTATGSRPSSSSSPPHARRKGRFTSEELPRGMSSVPYDIPGRPRVRAAASARIADDDRRTAGSPPIDNEHLPIHVRHDQLPRLPPGRRGLGRRSSAARPAETGDFATVGQRRRAARSTESTCASCSSRSGALSHTFHTLRTLRDHEAAGEEHIFTPARATRDHRVIDAPGRAATTPRSSTGCPSSCAYKPEAPLRATTR